MVPYSSGRVTTLWQPRKAGLAEGRGEGQQALVGRYDSWVIAATGLGS